MGGSRRILDFIGFDIDPNEKVQSISTRPRSWKSAKAMLLNPSILILDEVTAPLNLAEVEHLFHQGFEEGDSVAEASS